MPGWNVGLVSQLRESLVGLGTKGRSATREQIVKCVRDWWYMPENAKARNQKAAAAEHGLETMRLAVSFADMRPHVIEKAKTSLAAWEALREYAHSKVVAGECVEWSALAVLLRPEGMPPGRRKGSAPGNFNRDNQLAAALALVIERTNFKSLDAEASKLDKSAYAVIVEATDLTLEIARGAWKAHREVYQGK